MAHITFANKQSSKPVLQFYSEQRGELRRVAIEQSPFRIGRCETADLRIDSVQVSREHAEVYERGGCWFIRDLGSTNGTEVNCQVVANTILRDGDVIRFVDIELTFLDAAASPFQRMATQPAVRAAAPRPSAGLPSELVAARRALEATLLQAQPIDLQAIRSLRSQQVEGLVAMAGKGPAADDQEGQGVIHPAQALGEEVTRRRAVELACQTAPSGRLFVTLDCQGIQHPQMLAGALESLHFLTPADWQLGIALSTADVLDRWKLEDLARLIRDFDMLLLFKDFQGSAAQVSQLEPCAVEYLLLSSCMCEGFEASRQPGRRLESVVAACDQFDIRPVLPIGSGQAAGDICREFGVDLTVGPASSEPEPQVAEEVLAEVAAN